jgi:hypothetical protein
MAIAVCDGVGSNVHRVIIGATGPPGEAYLPSGFGRSCPHSADAPLGLAVRSASSRGVRPPPAIASAVLAACATITPAHVVRRRRPPAHAREDPSLGARR